jgi:hypothetical protein
MRAAIAEPAPAKSMRLVSLNATQVAAIKAK